MPAYQPDIALLRQALGNRIEACRSELIKSTLGWSRVYRVTLIEKGRSANDSVVVKTIDPQGPPTRLEADRELYFYRFLHPQLCIPKPQVYLTTTDEATGFHVIVMEDLDPKRRIPSHPHQWTRAELGPVLRAYARLHTSSFETLTYPWLLPRHETLLDFERIPAQVAVVQRAGIWKELPHLPDLIAYARASTRKYTHEKISLLHGDTTPANAALPKEPGSQPAVLIDWQDVGAGMPEFDLAYMDLQPFESARLVSRPELLDLYWRFRAGTGSGVPSPAERWDRQLHADLVTALWLTGSASRVALRPYPEGSYPHMHWVSQYGIVYNRLQSLGREITGSRP